jgi:hypothetical protein
VSGAEAFLESLTGDLAPLGMLALQYLDPDTTTDSGSGALCLRHRPEIAPEAYTMRLFPAAHESFIAKYEKTHQLEIPVPYRNLLLKMNGAFCFKICLLGLPRPMAETRPLLDRSTLWPLDLATGHKLWRTKYAAPSSEFLIGFGPAAEERIGYFLTAAGRVRGLLKRGEAINEWKSLADFLKAELERARAASEST